MPTEKEMKIALVDDDPSDRSVITEMVTEYMKQIGAAYTLCCYTAGQALLEDIHCGKRYNLLLLDVLMGDLNGMDLAAELRRQHNRAAIVFISNNREMALRGYEVSAVRYLAKPVEREKLEEALQHCYSRWQERKEILLPTDHGQHKISYSDIEYVEAFDRGTRFVLTGETVDSRLKFSEVHAMLPKNTFIHCHRAYIANVAHVRRLRPTAFEMRSGHHVPVSKHRYSDVSRKFFDYIAD